MRSLRLCALVELLFAMLGLWLAGTAPVSFAGGTYDDLLFLRLAAQLAHGHWLGPFDQLTLARGPAFPLFLAACALLRIPVNLAAQAVYLSASLLLARGVGRMLGSRPAASGIFAALAVLPVPYAAAMALVMREKLYLGVTMLALALALRCLPTRRPLGPALIWADLAWAGAAGLGFAVFWLTREEGVWLLPAVALVAALRLTHAVRWPGGGALRRLLGEAAVLGLAALGFVAVTAAVAAVNWRVYGVFRTNDFQSGPFPAAYGAMLRVKPEHWRRYVVLPRDVRQRLYAASEAARALEPALEGPSGHEWQRLGCQNSPLPGCDDLQGGWTMFAVRSAATEAGYYRSAAAADAFYRRLADEVDAACAAHRLDCLPPRRGMLPPLRRGHALPLLRSFASAAEQTATLRDARPGLLLTDPSLFDLAESEPFALGPAAPPLPLAGVSTVLAMGWTYAPAGAVLLSTRAAGGLAMSALSSTDNPDIVAAIGRSTGTARRFQWRSRCMPECRLTVSLGDATLLDRPAPAIRPGFEQLGSGVLLNIDAVRTAPAALGPGDLPLHAARGVARVMRAVSPVAITLAALGAFAMLGLDAARRRLRPATMAAGVLLLALLSRLALVALADATTVPALEFRFLAPGMVLAWALVGTVGAAAAVSRARRGLTRV